MKAESIIEQLVGQNQGWEQSGDWRFVVDKPAKFPGAACVNIDLESGILETVVMDGDPHQDGAGAFNVQDRYAVRVTLEPLD